MTLCQSLVRNRNQFNSVRSLFLFLFEINHIRKNNKENIIDNKHVKRNEENKTNANLIKFIERKREISISIPTPIRSFTSSYIYFVFCLFDHLLASNLF